MPLVGPARELLFELARAGAPLEVIGARIRSAGLPVSNATLRLAYAVARQGRLVGAEIERLRVRDLPSPRQVAGMSSRAIANYEYVFRMDFRDPLSGEVRTEHLTVSTDELITRSEARRRLEEIVREGQRRDPEKYPAGRGVGYLIETAEFARLLVRTPFPGEF